MANPAASLENIDVWPSCVFAINSEVDSKLIIIPIEKMRELLEYDDEVSAVEIRMTEGTSAKETASLQKEIAERLGPDFKVKNRFQQNESLYKMMKYEKAAIYMILINADHREKGRHTDSAQSRSHRQSYKTDLRT